jgi:hypothetical protein
MALDKDGRPIPAFVPDPREASVMHSPKASVEDEQLLIVQHKVDELLRVAEELSRRMMALEAKVDGALLDKIKEFQERFDAIAAQQMQGVQAQFDALKQDLLLRVPPLENRSIPPEEGNG